MSIPDKSEFTKCDSRRAGSVGSTISQQGSSTSSHTTGMEDMKELMDSAYSSSEVFLTQQLQAAHDHIAKLSMEKIGLGAQQSKSQARINELESECEAQISELAEVKEQLGQMVKTQDLTEEIDELKAEIQILNGQVEEDKTYIASLEEERRLDDLRLKHTIRGCEQIFIQREQALHFMSLWPNSIRDVQDMVNEQTEREGGPDPHVEAQLRQGIHKSGSHTATKRGRDLNDPEPMAEQFTPSLPPLKKLKVVKGKLAKKRDDCVSMTPGTPIQTLPNSYGMPETSNTSSAQGVEKNSEIASEDNVSKLKRSAPSVNLRKLLGKDSDPLSKSIHPESEAGDRPKITEGLASSKNSRQAEKTHTRLRIEDMADVVQMPCPICNLAELFPEASAEALAMSKAAQEIKHSTSISKTVIKE